MTPPASIHSRVPQMTKKAQSEAGERAARGAADQDKEIPSLSGLIKDEIVLITFLVFFVGIISTDRYYAAFGVKYQFLDMPPFHIIYRGLTVLIDAPYLLLPYAAAVAWLGFDSHAVARGWRGFTRFRGSATYALILLLLLITYPLALLAGDKQASRDIYEQSCTLPKIINLKVASEAYGFDRKYRLLVVDSDYLVIFKPLDQSEGESIDNTIPNIKRFSKGDVHLVETTR